MILLMQRSDKMKIVVVLVGTELRADGGAQSMVRRGFSKEKKEEEKEEEENDQRGSPFSWFPCLVYHQAYGHDSLFVYVVVGCARKVGLGEVPSRWEKKGVKEEKDFFISAILFAVGIEKEEESYCMLILSSIRSWSLRKFAEGGSKQGKETSQG